MNFLRSATLLVLGLLFAASCVGVAGRGAPVAQRCPTLSAPPAPSLLLTALGEPSLVAVRVHAIELDGAAPAEALLTARSADERSAVVAVFFQQNSRWILRSQRRDAVSDPGTFDVSNGWEFDAALDAGGCRQHALLRFTDAQGAFDPRSERRSFSVLTLRGASIARTLRCPLSESTVMGPERETSVLLSRAVEREQPATLVLRDEQTRSVVSRLSWRADHWIESPSAGCESAIEPLAL